MGVWSQVNMLAMAEVNTSKTEKMPTTVLCARERTMLRERRRRALGKREPQEGTAQVSTVISNSRKILA